MNLNRPTYLPTDPFCALGITKYTNGDVFIGTFAENVVHGSGVLTYAHGDR